MTPPYGARPVLHLHPGQVHASATAAAISTVLGSCVAVCLWDHSRSAGGANHFVLPHRSSNMTASARFCNVAVDQLVTRMEAIGSPRRALAAKIFGGACVLRAFRGKSDHMGARNVEAARVYLRELGIPIIGEDTGGFDGRRLIFQTDDGAALVRLL